MFGIGHVLVLLVVIVDNDVDTIFIRLYISITIVQSYTEKYHKFVAVGLL